MQGFLQEQPAERDREHIWAQLDAAEDQHILDGEETEGAKILHGEDTLAVPVYLQVHGEVGKHEGETGG